MKAQELRMGNLYWYQMIDSQDERERWLEQSVIDTDDLIWLFSNPDDPDFMPIEITAEWLLKSGFVLEDSKSKKSTAQWFVKYLDENNQVGVNVPNKLFCLGENVDWIYPMKIQYIHQLQNLYHSLTGEELQILNPKS